MLAVWPESARETHPGQVPRLALRPQHLFDGISPAVDPSRPAEPWSEKRYFSELHRPVIKAEDITRNLSIPCVMQKDLLKLIQDELRSGKNELTLRRSLFTKLRLSNIDSTARQIVASRAISYFRSQLPKDDFRRPRLYAKSLSMLKSLVVVTELNPVEEMKEPDSTFERLVSDPDRPVTKAPAPDANPASTPKLLMKAPAPGQAAPVGAGGIGGGSEGDPPGTRKTWGNKVVEKQPDGKWKVVERLDQVPRLVQIPPLDFDNLSEEQAAHLIEQLKMAAKVKGKQEKA